MYSHDSVDIPSQYSTASNFAQISAIIKILPTWIFKVAINDEVTIFDVKFRGFALRAHKKFFELMSLYIMD
jgi:hypothetical protein